MKDESVESIILASLVRNEEFVSKVIRYIKPEYFVEKVDQMIFEGIASFVEKYNASPSIKSLWIDFKESDKFTSEELFNQTKDRLNHIGKVDLDDFSVDWSVDAAKNFCHKRATFIAASEFVAMMDQSEQGNNGKLGESLQKLQDAVFMSFDAKFGHDYFGDSEERLEWYHKKEKKVPFDLDYFNRITEGGVEDGSVQVIMAGTYVGKTLLLCHFASAHLLRGLNVLYISLELSKERIASRIDANILDIPISELFHVNRNKFRGAIEEAKHRTVGKLKIERYPTSQASVQDFQQLLDNLKTADGFEPDVIYIDYLNIMASSSMKFNGDTYTYVGRVIEELRGFAVKNEVPVFTATQATRAGQDKTKLRITDTSDSMNVPRTADFMVALVCDEELRELNQIKVDVLKSRYSDATVINSFLIGVDRSKMRFYDLDETLQQAYKKNKKDDEDDDVSGFDKTSFGKRMKKERKDKTSKKSSETEDWDI